MLLEAEGGLIRFKSRSVSKGGKMWKLGKKVNGGRNDPRGESLIERETVLRVRRGGQ